MADEKYTLTIGDSIDMLIAKKAANLKIKNNDAVTAFRAIQQSYKNIEFSFKVIDGETIINVK